MKTGPFLLDTHTLLWWFTDAEKLSPVAFDIISDGSHDIFLSSVSLWEIKIKQSLNKLTLPSQFKETLERQDFLPLSMSWEHAYGIGQLPSIHKDPFDRLLISQAMIEKLSILTKDIKFQKYPVKVVW